MLIIGIDMYKDYYVEMFDFEEEDENPMFVNASIGDYRIIEGKGFYDIPYEKIGRY